MVDCTARIPSNNSIRDFGYWFEGVAVQNVSAIARRVLNPNQLLEVLNDPIQKRKLSHRDVRRYLKFTDLLNYHALRS